MESLMDSSSPLWNSAGGKVDSWRVSENYNVWMSAAGISEIIHPVLHPVAESLTVTNLKGHGKQETPYCFHIHPSNDVHSDKYSPRIPIFCIFSTDFYSNCSVGYMH